MKTEFELAILRRFGTYRECEKFMKWGPGAVTKIVQKKRHLKASEIEKLVSEFNVSSYDHFNAIFFESRLPNGKKEAKQ